MDKLTRTHIKAYFELCKIKIALLSTFSAVTGFLLAAGNSGAFARPYAGVLFSMTAGVFLLASGSCALNHYQERTIDALMPRTHKRPIPSGRIRPARALLFSLGLMLLGITTLLLSELFLSMLLGTVTVALYNVVYTPLKQKSAFAVIPGSLTGALPPAIGWAAAGGPLMDYELLTVCFFFFMWQVPHSWIFALKYGVEYECAGLPSLTRRFALPQLLRINFVWTCATAVSCLFIIASGMVRNTIIVGALLAASVWLVGNGALLLKEKAPAYSPAFNTINAYMAFVVFLLAGDTFFI